MRPFLPAALVLCIFVTGIASACRPMRLLLRQTALKTRGVKSQTSQHLKLRLKKGTSGTSGACAQQPATMRRV